MPHLLKLVDGSVAIPMGREDLLRLIEDRLGGEIRTAVENEIQGEIDAKNDLEEEFKCYEGTVDSYRAALLEVINEADAYTRGKTKEAREFANRVIEMLEAEL